MRNILFVGLYPNPNEKYRNVFYQNLIFAMAEQGIRCTVISPVSVMRHKTKIKRIPKRTVDVTPRGAKVDVYYPRVFSASSIQIGSFNTELLSERWFESGAMKVAKKLIKRGEKFDAVYGHFFLFGGLAAIKIGNRFNLPSFVAFGECDYESQVQKTYGDLTSKDVKGIGGVIAVSTKNANVLRGKPIFDGVPMIIAPNSVNHELFNVKDKQECRKQLGLPSDKFIVGFVGGFIDRKGDKRLLEAVNQIDDVYLAFAGKGDNPPQGERVLFCKPLKHEDVSILLNAVDVFCLPTLSEGSCNAVVEAMSCGVPVISSDLAFNDDVLTDKNSIRVDPTSVSEIRDAILKLKTDVDFCNSIKTQSLARAKDLNITTRAKNILAFMEKVKNERK